MSGRLTQGQGRSGAPSEVLLWSVYQTLIWWTVWLTENGLGINSGWWIATTMKIKILQTDGKKCSAINNGLELIISLPLGYVCTVHTCKLAFLLASDTRRILFPGGCADSIGYHSKMLHLALGVCLLFTCSLLKRLIFLIWVLLLLASTLYFFFFFD